MSTERAELPGEDEERGWRDRIAGVAAAAQSLFATRLDILREELSEKALFAAKGFAAVTVAAALAIGALLLFAALLAALFARLFNSNILGILAAGLVYGIGAAAAAWMGWKALTRVRPLEFPAVTSELARDWQAVSASLAPEAEAQAEPPAGKGQDAAIEDLEERFRAGEE